MKTTFKKALAAVSAAAVVAASAALLAVPASAEAGTVTIGTVDITLADLQAANYQVTVPLTFSIPTQQYGLGINYAEGLTFVDSESHGGFMASLARANTTTRFLVATGANDVEVSDGSVDLVFTVESSAQPGDSYSLTGATVMADGRDAIYNDGVPTYVDGAINIIAEPTEPPTATPATTTTPASPQTGDFSGAPIVGVVVAVAVIGGVALFSKKRK